MRIPRMRILRKGSLGEPGARDRPVVPRPRPWRSCSGASFSASALRGEEMLEPATPLLQTLPRASAGENAWNVRIDRVQVPQELIQIEVQMLQQVNLVHQHQIRRAEHERVLERLLLPFGDGVDHDPGVLPNLKLRRAHQVAYVLYYQDVYIP